MGSWDDLWAPLVELETGKRYKPVAWKVSVRERVIEEHNHGEPPQARRGLQLRRRRCGRDVTVRRA